jgi:TPR repeat protein
MWEIFEWPPRSPRSAWIFIGTIFVVCLLGLGLLLKVPSTPPRSDEERQAVLDYTNGYGLKLSLIEGLAQSGDPVAQLELGERYMAGEEVIKNVAQGLKWMKASSDNGYSRAHRRFAMFYDDVMQSATDVSVSCTYHYRAAYAGSAESQYLVGTRLRDGIGFRRDVVEAYAWLRLASVHSLPAYRARVALEQGPDLRLSPEELDRARALSRQIQSEIEAKKFKK